MIFLIEYDRAAGRLASIKTFDDAQRELAENERLSMELALHHQQLLREVVLLEAHDQAALLRTHGRYFESLQDLAAQGVETAAP